MSNLGWVSLHRKIMDNWLWEDKPFAHGQAWVDMLLMANHKSNRFPLGEEIITLQPGEFVTSELKLMGRWGWSKSKVRRFLQLLEKDGMIVKKTDRKKTTIIIVNFTEFQNMETNSRPIKDQSQTNSRPIKDTNNNVNNDNNVDNINYQQIADMYNDTCVSFPRLTKLSEKRKKAIKARLKTYTLDDLKKLFEMAESSSFLKGQNNHNWSATFDWLISDGNMAKVLDGNYSNKGQKGVSEPVGDNTYNTDAEWERCKRIIAEARNSGEPREKVFG